MNAARSATLFADQAIAQLPVIGPRSPIRAVLSTVSDLALDIVSCRSSATRYRREFDTIDAQSDACFVEAQRLAASIGADRIVALIGSGLALDDQERRPLGKFWGLFDQAADCGRHIILTIEKLPGMRKRGGQR